MKLGPICLLGALLCACPACASELAPGDEGHNMAGIGIVAGPDVALIKPVSQIRLRDHINVRRVIAHSPAAKAGLMPGDEIVKVDGEKLGGMKFVDAIVNLIRGPLGAPVKLSIVRSGATPQQLTCVVVRDIVPAENK